MNWCANICWYTGDQPYMFTSLNPPWYYSHQLSAPFGSSSLCAFWSCKRAARNLPRIKLSVFNVNKWWLNTWEIILKFNSNFTGEFRPTHSIPTTCTSLLFTKCFKSSPTSGSLHLSPVQISPGKHTTYSFTSSSIKVLFKCYHFSKTNPETLFKTAALQHPYPPCPLLFFHSTYHLQHTVKYTFKIRYVSIPCQECNLCARVRFFLCFYSYCALPEPRTVPDVK